TYLETNYPTAAILTIPEVTVEELVQYVKQKLGLSSIRMVGDLTARCKRVGVLAGYRGGGVQAVPLFDKENLDVILYGEGPEWETPEYVRDAVYQGSQKALLVLGHAESEAPGMKYLAVAIKQYLPDIPVHFIAERPVLSIV
ncbi:MAG: Nif3-like dinuclear metal center hexameric protein, partial [Gorillibacterium sp.]|nr:Nif3-like dinuclear metal center hexameric protein [Gorillibacterium sp.]